MANPLVADPHPPSPENFVSLSVPPPEQGNDVISDESGADFTLDDFDLPFNDIFPPSDADFLSFSPKNSEPLIGSFSDSSRIFKSSPEFRTTSEVCRSSSGSHVSTNQISVDRNPDVSGFLNMPTPESHGSDETSFLNCSSPESQGSGNYCGSNDSEALNCPNKPVTSSPNLLTNYTNSIKFEQNFKLEEMDRKCSSVLKRKKVSEDSNKVRKYQKSDADVVECSNVSNEEDEKRKARLMRNRESAQLSRQRKKHYVEELEDKVRSMHSTIQDLNAKISYIMSENATLRSQMGSTSVAAPQMPPPPPGMYPVMYPWMPCAPPYMVKAQGSQVPLVPIPRLKPHAAAPAPKSSKKSDNKKTEMKTKKVASISFLGLLFCMLLFGGLVPMVNMRFGGVREHFTSGDISGNGYNERHHGRVLAVDGQLNGSSYVGKLSGKDYGTHCGRRGEDGDNQPNFTGGNDEFVQSANGSEPLMASLYVPRNDKLVKIDGNLIIHSVLASEKAMDSQTGDRKRSGETGLAVPGDLAPAIPGRHPHHYHSPADGKRALSSGDKDKAKSTVQQWFLEGVAGPMLSSGMCTEVFQFDVSSAIVPANTVRDVSMEQRQNATHTKGRNRRILNGLSVPLSGVPHNISEEHSGRTGKKDQFTGNSSLSSLVVSVLVDPREAGDADGDGIMGPKSISRIFVVVLMDSVKYVTYSCMLPFKGSIPLVTT